MTTITTDSRFNLRDGLVTEVIDDEMVVLDLEDNVYFGLNAVGLVIWGGIDAGDTFAEIVESIVAEFEVDRETAEADARAFLGDLAERGLVQVEE